MPDDIRKKMEALLSAHSGRKAPPKADKKGDDPHMLNFRQEFKKLCEDVVLPALRDTAELLRHHGHDCDVEEQEATEVATGEKITLNCRMRIFPAGFGRTFFQKSEPPYVCVMPEEQLKTVRVIAGTSLPSKPRKPTSNDYAMSEINAEVIEQECFGVLQAILEASE